MLDELKEALAEKDMTFQYTEQAAELIAKNSFSQKYGARNMRRYICREVEDPLAEKIIESSQRAITHIHLGVTDSTLQINCM
jgi:ATP-dependent Clp protease ATP-binding subunit ClpB